MELNSLMKEINKVEKQTGLLEKDIAYLAQSYITENTNFELPMNDIDCIECEPIIQISYQDLLERVVRKIKEQSPHNTYIDERNLMTYIDYYYQFIDS
jgi:hypothetical protein